MTAFQPGDQVELVSDFSFWDAGHPGEVVPLEPASLLNGHDVAVQLVGKDTPSVFYDREIRTVAEWQGLPHYIKDQHDLDWMATGRGVVVCKCGDELGTCPSSGTERINAAGALRRVHWAAVTALANVRPGDSS